MVIIIFWHPDVPAGSQMPPGWQSQTIQSGVPGSRKKIPVKVIRSTRNNNDDDTNFVFLADRWNSKNLSDSRYVWLPLQFHDDTTGDPFIQWPEEWSPKDFFGKKTKISKH
mmetsp:Transcript_21720/g.23287  ORF Transcript_21720/g.23287 Transcript_21720/m.23287 type:complete len:111 (+) Transcript_21720:75-407(+)